MRISVAQIKHLIGSVMIESQERDLLKKWTLNSDDKFERELARLDIYPIRRDDNGDVSSILGKGAYNIVFDVVYEGKRRAARLSQHKGEVDTLLKFVSYKDKLPAKFRKHFPKTYLTFEISIYGKRYYGVILELLQQLPNSLRHELDNVHTVNAKGSRVEFFQNEKAVAHLIAKIDTSANNRVKLMQFYRNHLVQFFQYTSKIDTYDYMHLLGKKFEHERQLMLDDKEYVHALDIFHDSVQELWWSTVIPMSSYDENLLATHSSSRKIRQFIEFLQALAAVGFRWQDMHIENFMQRGTTGDLVVVDPGMFIQVR